MTVSVSYWPLLILVLIPFLWWVRRNTHSDFESKHLNLSAVVRAMILLALIAALMEPVVHRPTASVSVAYLLDISRSVSGRSIEASLDWIEKTNQKGRPAQARFIPFARNSAVFANLEEAKDVDVNSIDQTGTNIQGAIERAIQSFDPHGLKRLVLISDGNENVGGMDELLSQLKKENIRVYTKAEAAQSNADAWIESVMVPAQAEPEELFPVDVHVYSQVDTTGEVRLKSDGKHECPNVLAEPFAAD